MASVGIGQVALNLVVNTAKWKDGWQEAAGVSDKQMRQMQRRAEEFGKAMGAALAGAAAAITALTVHAINAADDMNDLAQKTGVTTERLSTLSLVANQSGANINVLGSGMVRLTKAASDAALGVSAPKRAFDALGISVKDTQGNLRPTGDLLDEVAKKLSGYADGANKTAIAVALFGRSDADLIPTLNAVGEGTQEADKYIDALGARISTETAHAADDFNDKLELMKLGFTGLGNQLAQFLLPYLNDYADAMLDTATESKGATDAAKGIATGITYVGVAAVQVKSVVEGLVNFIAATFDSLKNLSEAALKYSGAGAFKLLTKEGREDLETLASGVRTAWSTASDGIQTSMDNADKTVKKMLERLDEFKNKGKAAADGVTRLPDLIVRPDKAQAPAMQIGGDAAKSASKAYDSLTDSMKGTSAAMDDMQSRFQAQTDAMLAQVQLASDVAAENELVSSGYYQLSRAQQQYIATQQQAAAAMARSIAAGNDAGKALQTYLDTMLNAGKIRDKMESVAKAFDIGAIIERNQPRSPLATMLGDLGKLQGELEKAKKGMGEFANPDGIDKLNKAIEQIKENMLSYALDGLGRSMQMMQQLTEKGSKGYKAMEDGIAAVSIAQDILAMKAAVTAVLTQGEGDPYSAWARMLAMAAAVAPYVASIGVTLASFGGGGGPSSQSAEVRQKAQGTGSVLGDASAKSESIANAVELTAKATEKLVGINTGMRDAIVHLAAALGQASTLLARGAGDIKFPKEKSSGLFLGLFGSSKTIIDQGIVIAGGRLEDMLNSIVVGAYQTIHKNGGLFGGSSNHDNVVSLADDVSKQFELVLNSLVDAVREGAKAIGLNMDDINAAIAQFHVAEIRISLKDLSAEDQQKELEAVFSQIFDGLAGAVVPFIDQFQQVGEGLGETLVRVATEVQVMQQAIKQLGLTVDETDPEKFAQISDGLIQLMGGVDNFVDAMQGFINNFAPDDWKLKTAQDALTSAFDQLGLTLPDTADGLWALMQSLDATTEAGRQQIAVILGLSDTASAYYKLIEKAQQDALEKQQALAKAQADYYTLSASLQAEAGMNPLAQKILEIGQWSRDTSQKLVDLAKAAGMAGARTEDLALVQTVATKRMEAAIAALYESSQSLVDQLYGTGGAAESASHSVSSFGDAMTTAAQKATDAINLLLGNLSPLKDGAKLQLALQGQLAGTVRPEQVLEIARRLYATGADYDAIFARVMAVGDRTQRGGASAGGGANAAMKEVAQKTLSKAERYQLADQLANNIADLASAQSISFEDVADKLGLNLADLGKDLGLDNKALQDYLSVLASDNFGLNDLQGVLADQVDRLIAAITGQPLSGAGIDASGATSSTLDGGSIVPSGAAAYNPVIVNSNAELGAKVDALTATVGELLTRVADNTSRSADATEKGAEEQQGLRRDLTGMRLGQPVTRSVRVPA